MVVGLMLNMKELADIVSGSSVDFQCPFCPCRFSSQIDLDLHLKRFDNVDHWELWRCVHIVLEADGVVAGVDSHADWHWSHKRSYVPFRVVKKCRKLLDERGFVL